ncbi:unnamed protein product [marine sediment metagenome]|uniref:SHOCT domain-containing protein n=1 Tax=marine sediment metagenome TaxID=412755 RepID=X1LN92_9ZZZZ
MNEIGFTEEGAIIIWLILCFIVGAIGTNRKIGFWKGFFFSLLLSPVFGAIITFISPKKESVVVINQSKSESSLSVADELKKYQELKDAGTITEEEFKKIKERLLSKEA